jgi:hypothetical protein
MRANQVKKWAFASVCLKALRARDWRERGAQCDAPSVALKSKLGYAELPVKRMYERTVATDCTDLRRVIAANDDARNHLRFTRSIGRSKGSLRR